MASLFNVARTSIARQALKSSAGVPKLTPFARAAVTPIINRTNNFVTWAPSSEPTLSEVQQNPGPPPPVENIGVDAV